ncbi:GumC domain-containing protein [Clostridium estertheticum]|uniref:Uncharacterized protein n=1 Tax=Clostridium estertheticum subsp. estertheticum TaxID=1552 RepID=A0A1J0GH46_9CLOT|nr:hypothetical protein [Clostridium estertheticum]APC40599.1 hypothetical protein A7L45_11225 [Clostridium estertheticum subsp. estertheticum]MBU3170820.1 hypothetical protein [Clostridium estertheticum]MBZ9617574.1 hypothetical protein [Clostridium estertheticum subsp. laramiense]WAG73251.1 hypothetical protein LL032_19210 [Clostridium estertheticum]
MDAILSVRISDEIKQKFNELAQSEGINNKEFMEQVVKYYELNKAREEDSNMSSDINELQTITNRISDIYINIVERNNIKTLEVKNVHKNELVDKEKEVQKLYENIISLKEEKKEENKRITLFEKDQSDNKHIVKELQENAKSLKTLNNMQGEKILKLNETNEKYIKYKDEILVLKTELEKLTNENIQLKQDLSNKNEEARRLTKQVDESNKINEKKIDELETKAKQDIEVQKERGIFQMDKELLKLKEEQQLKIQELQESFNERINGLLKEKEEAAEKFNNMVSEINEVRTKQTSIKSSTGLL